MTTQQPAILPHHQAAAAMWNAGGRHYDDVSFAISDALGHAAARLDAQAGERVLDIATGTGWSARNVARTGAHVTAIDIAADLLAAARRLSAHAEPPITFLHADAEQLPFADGAFDGVISTFGVMFAVDQKRAAAEIARVVRPGGRLALTAWAPGGAVAEFFGVIGKHSEAPPPPVSPLNWGAPDQVMALLGEAFELTFEPGVSNAYHASTQQIWDWYVRGFGPLRQLSLKLSPDRLAALKQDMDAYHAHYAVPAGLHVRRDYLLTLGRRK
jgi:SAM-dependent methyltransferase